MAIFSAFFPSPNFLQRSINGEYLLNNFIDWLIDWLIWVAFGVIAQKVALTGIRTPDLETWNLMWNCHRTCSTRSQTMLYRETGKAPYDCLLLHTVFQLGFIRQLPLSASRQSWPCPVPESRKLNDKLKQNHHAITPFLRNRASLSLSKSKISRRTQSVCWPSVGGGRRGFKSQPRMFTGLLTRRNGPARGCTISDTKSLWCTCGSAKTWANVFTGPKGNLASSFWNNSSHSLRDFRWNAPDRRRISSSRFSTRTLLDLNFSSSW